MKNIAICYREHAIRVSDSYCSGNSSISNQPNYNTKTPYNNSIQNSATTSTYKIRLSTQNQFLIRLTYWCNLLFSITISDSHPFSASKSTKSFKTPRGTKNLEYNGSRVEVHWDLSRARYGPGPEPIADYYVIVLVDSELSLILGDTGRELLDVLKKKPSRVCSDFSLISRREYFSGGEAAYASRARFSETGACHDILIKCWGGENDDEKSIINRGLSVCVDGKSVVEVKRLRWSFRGNETIFVDGGILVDLMWDVHDWLFSPGKGGYGVFMFRTRRGLMDSRLWLEEENEENYKVNNEFSFLICARL